MISVGNRDGRKRLGSRLEMEDTELEEGEAFSYHDEGQDSTIDPDIDLSYIGEKLQNVLGHFQKDFEGGVSAENLGAKFGGYGSFLPTYQRSPSWSHTKSPAGAHNFGSPKSPRRQHVEDQRRNSIASSIAYPSVRSHAASRRAASVDNSVRENHLQSKHAGESNSKGGAITKPANSSDQRTLKVRIKVGSENLSTQKNAEIYSGLGLEVSPSSSLDCSPAISEGRHAKGFSVPEESPTSILQIMTSYPRELLLSPLPEDLIHLTEKIKIRENKRLDNASTESSGMLGNGYLFGMGHKKSEKKTHKPNGKDDTFSVDLPIQKSSGDKDYKVPLLKKENESEADNLGYEELVSNALKLPLLLGTQQSTADPVKDVPAATNFSMNSSNGVERETCSTFKEEERLDAKFDKLGGLLGSSGKVPESKKGKSSSAAAFPQADTPLEEKSHALEQSESNTSKGRKGPRLAGTPERSKEFPKGGSSNVEGPIRTSEKSSTGSKRKQKSGGSVKGVSTVKDELMVESSLGHCGVRKSHSNNLMPKNDSYDPQKVHEKTGNRYKDFFGDIEFENEDNESISGEMTSSGGLKNGTVAKKGLSKHNMKEKCNADNLGKPVPPDTHHRFASHVDPLHENGVGSEPPTGTVPVVKEDWVSCDKCHKWRLLPLGTNPNSLPHKWICRMLNWLPGMNRCSIPEEETTNALMALYNPAAPIPARASEGQHTRVNDSVGASVGMTSVDAKYPDFAQENDVVQTTAVSGKKKHGSSKALDAADLNGSTKSSNLCKKNLATPAKTSNISNRSRSPSLDTHGYQNMPQSAGVAEKYSDAKREKLSLVNSADQGPNLNKRSKTDPVVSRAPKRIKSEELRFDDDDWTYENVGNSSKAGRGSSSLSNNTSDNDRYKYNNRKDLSAKTNNTVSEKHVPGASTDDLPRSGKLDKESVRKRKAKEPHGSQVHTEPFSSSGRCQPESGEFPEELLESDRRKEKKARLSKSGGKETTSGNKTSFGSDRKTKGAKDQYNGQYLSNNQAADYLKNDMGPVQPLVAANSSSSKVSGSHKSKNGQEIKGSPVESVSSSPLRFHNADRVASSRKNLDARDDFHDVGFLSAASPKRLSGGEDGGNDRSGMVKNHVTEMYNDNMCQSNQHGSVKRYSEQHGIEEKTNADQSHNSELHAKKSGKSGSKDKLHFGSGSDKVNVKTLDSSHDSDHAHLYEKSKSRRSRSDEKSGNPNKVEKFITKKDTAGGTSGESSKGPNQKKFGLDGPDAMKSQDKKQVLDSEKLPRKNGQADAGHSEKSHPLPPSAKVQNEVTASLRPVADSQKENSLKAVAADALDNGDTKEPNQRKRSENPNGKPVRHPTPNSHKVRDVDAPSPLRRDSSSHAANSALKEAKDLKHLADRLKNSGSGESIGYYFQAALKFLHGASLLESGSSEAPKHNDLMHSMHIYSSTAKLCGFCAHEYEKLKDMSAAALAYKCMEVAYMRVVYSSHTSASRDRSDLQNALQIAPSGESPSSSASDVDNLNHQATDKAALAKVVSSPQVSGSHIITSRTRSGFLRILSFAQDVNFAMEASRKSKIAFAAATSRLEETSQGESISSLKKALDFNFQDVDSLLRLVRVAMEAIAR